MHNLQIEPPFEPCAPSRPRARIRAMNVNIAGLIERTIPDKPSSAR